MYVYTEPCKLLLQLCEQHGVSSSELLGVANTTPSELDQEFITLNKFIDLGLTAIELTKIPHLGLLYGHKLNVMAHGMAGVTALASANSLEALYLFAELNTRANAPFMQIEVTETEELVSVHLKPTEEVKRAERFFLESAIASCVKLCRAVSRKDNNSVVTCRLRQPLNEMDREVYESELKLPVEFHPSDHGVTVRKSALLVDSPFSNPTLLKTLAANIPSLPEADDENIRNKIIQLFDSFDAHIPPLKVTAQHLAMSPRHVSRKLSELGTSYQSLADEYKSEKAEKWLREGILPISEIAFRLGYSDTSAFNKAFKRWLQCSPSDFRSQSKNSI